MARGRIFNLQTQGFGRGGMIDRMGERTNIRFLESDLAPGVSYDDLHAGDTVTFSEHYNDTPGTPTGLIHLAVNISPA